MIRGHSRPLNHSAEWEIRQVCPTQPNLFFSRQGRKRAEKGRKGTKVRDSAIPFMPFCDVLCPLVPDNEKGQKVRWVRDNAIPFLPFSALCYLCYPTTKVPHARANACPFYLASSDIAVFVRVIPISPPHPYKNHILLLCNVITC